MEINEEVKKYLKKDNRIAKKTTDWSSYNFELEKMEYKLEKDNYKNKRIKNKYKAFIDILKEALRNIGAVKKSVVQNTEEEKKKVNTKGEMPAIWWDEECEKVKEREEKLKKWIRKKDMESFIEYKRVKAAVCKTIKRKKREF